MKLLSVRAWPIKFWHVKRGFFPLFRIEFFILFVFYRYTQDPKELWDWFEPYLDDDEVSNNTNQPSHTQHTHTHPALT